MRLLYRTRVLSNIGKYSFGFRIVDKWNSLSAEVISSNSLNAFKNKLDLIIKNDWGLV